LRVFFDEDVPRELVRLLPQHDIHTVVGMEWGGIKNGALLTLIEREGFQVFLTGDKNIVFDKFCLPGQFSSAEAFGVTMPGHRRFAPIRRVRDGCAQDA
jgi:hypothetical protein